MNFFTSDQKQQLQFTTLIIGAVALTVGLAWSSGIQALIDSYIPQNYADSKNAWYKVLYAILLTAFVYVFFKFL
jgi:Family of unknown function (DUF5654)